MSNQVYWEQTIYWASSLRYIHIITKNVVWILNRIASLMRRKRYNMEEVSLSFDNENKAHFIIAVDWALLDVQQVVNQIDKLYDVYQVYDATHLHNEFFNAFYVMVSSEDEFKDFPFKTISIVKKWNKAKWVFMLSLEDSKKFSKFLDGKDYSYIRRLVSLI